MFKWLTKPKEEYFVTRAVPISLLVKKVLQEHGDTHSLTHRLWLLLCSIGEVK